MQVGQGSISAILALLALGGCAHAGTGAAAETDERLVWLADALADSLEDVPQVPTAGPVGRELDRLEALLAARHPLALVAGPAENLVFEVTATPHSLDQTAGQPIALVPTPARAPAAAPPPRVAEAQPDRGPLFQVELGRFETPELARLVWGELLAAAPLALGGLEPSTPAAAGGVVLRAGPLPNAEAATEVCDRLAGLGVACASQRLGGGA